MTAVPLSPTTVDNRRAVIGVAQTFATNGLLIAAVGGTLPALRDRLGLSASGVSALLFTLAVSSLISMQVSGRLTEKFNARIVSLTSISIFTLGVGLLAIGSSLTTAIPAMILCGIGNGAGDISMNALGVQVEKLRQTPIMSRFHAAWSVGNLASAGLVVLVGQLLSAGDGSAASSGRAVALALGSMCLISAVSTLVLRGTTPDLRSLPDKPEVGSMRLGRLAAALGLIAFCFGLAEGTAVDWSSIHLTDVTTVDPSTGALGLAAVSSSMLIVRLLGDRVVTRFGRRSVVRVGGTIAAVGYAVTVVSDTLLVVLGAWSLVGLGVGLIAPQIYAAAGHAGGSRMLATVVTAGYASFLIGPAILGQLVDHYGIQLAMILPLSLSAALVIIAAALPRPPGPAGPEV